MWTLIAIWLVIVPEGQNNAASWENKDAKNILLILKDYIKHIILVPIDNKNSYTLKELKIISDDLELSSYTRDSIKEALTSSVINSSSKVLVFGSLYLIGETLKLDNN